MRENRTEYVFLPDLSDASCMVGDISLSDFMVVVRERLLAKEVLKARRKQSLFFDFIIVVRRFCYDKCRTT